MRFVPIVILLLSLSALPVHAQLFLFGGMDHAPLGTATLSEQGGKLKISNLGSSGQDGVSISYGGGSGGSIIIEPMLPQVLTTGMVLDAEFETDAGVTETALVRFARDPIGGVSLNIDNWPCADPVTGVTVTLYNDDVVQHVIQGTQLQNILSVPQTPSVVTFDVFDPTPLTLKKTGASDLMYRAWLDFLPFVFATDGGTFNFQVNRIEIAAADPGVTGGHIESLSVTAGALQGTEMTFDKCYRKKVSRRATSSGQARVDIVSSGDLDCDGVDETNFPKGALKISNLGSSGCDGVSIAHDDDDVSSGFQVRSFVIGGGGGMGKVTHQIDGTLAGGPPQEIFRAEITGNGTGSTELSWLYDGAPDPAASVEICRGGVLIASYVNVSAPIHITGDDSPIYFGQFSEPNHTVSIRYEYASPRSIDVGGDTTLGDVVVVKWLDKSSTKLQGSIMMGTGLSCDMYVTGTPNGQNLTGQPQGNEPVVVTALHNAELEQPESGKLKISNLGSSGCDGFSIAPPDEDDDDYFDTIDMRVSGLRTAVDQPTGEVHLEATGRLTGDSSSRLLGTLSMVSNGTDVSCTPNYSGVGTTSVRVYIYDGGSLVSEYVSPDRVPAVSFVSFPTGCGKEPASGPGGQTLCFVMDWDFPQTFITGQGQVVGDEVRVIAETASAPLDRLSEFTVRAKDHEPFVFYDIILLAQNPTSTPGILSQVTSLRPNYPNPFNPQTTLSFDLAQSGPASLAIYSLDGRLVRTMVNESMTAGHHQIVWNGTDATGQRVSSGVYLVKLRSVGADSAQKVTLIK